MSDISNNISICMAGCLLKEKRLDYLNQSLEKFIKHLPDAEYIIALDRDTDTPKDWENNFDVQIVKKSHNLGLGHSWNWAYRQATKKYILHTEEDWAIFTEDKFKDILNLSIEVIEKEDGIFRFDNMCQDFWESGWTEKQIYNRIYYELNRPKRFQDLQIYYYSNRPHIKKNEFTKKNNLWHIENAPPPKVEMYMCEKYFKSQKKVFFLPETSIGHIGVESIRDE